ncbi:MAG: F0F1 ATP synthase subunit epsilon [Deltaproteobacteria bacterium]|nr:F0F1 ATP synthase subunit epsilon [Deltaproteobacteria bacterium]
MASTIRLELVSPERLLISADVEEVVAPGHEGEFGVLPEHTHFLALLSIGVLRYRQGGELRKVAVGGGFAEVSPERVIVMAHVAEKAEEIDVERAERARERAEVEMARNLSLDDATYRKAHGALQRALARLSAAE